MSHRRAATILAGTALVGLSAAGCATGDPPREAEPEDSGECAFEVRNETSAVLSVTAGGSRVRQLGSLDPGQSLQFHERCDVDRVIVTGSVAQSTGPSVGPGPGQARDRTVERTVSPWPNHIVRVPLRFSEGEIRGSTGRTGGELPLPPGAEEPGLPGSCPGCSGSPSERPPPP